MQTQNTIQAIKLVKLFNEMQCTQLVWLPALPCSILDRMRFSSCCLTPGHQTEEVACSEHLVIP